MDEPSSSDSETLSDIPIETLSESSSQSNTKPSASSSPHCINPGSVNCVTDRRGTEKEGIGKRTK